jgi:hypothetical protein
MGMVQCELVRSTLIRGHRSSIQRRLFNSPKGPESLRRSGASKLTQGLSNTTAIRHRIKRCDRLLGNSKLEAERHLVYAAMTRHIMCGIAQPLIIVDWSDLRADRSQQLLRAALMVQGRTLTLYEEVHSMSRAASLKGGQICPRMRGLAARALGARVQSFPTLSMSRISNRICSCRMKQPSKYLLPL